MIKNIMYIYTKLITYLLLTIITNYYYICERKNWSGFDISANSRLSLAMSYTKKEIVKSLMLESKINFSIT